VYDETSINQGHVENAVIEDALNREEATHPRMDGHRMYKQIKAPYEQRPEELDQSDDENTGCIDIIGFLKGFRQVLCEYIFLQKK